MLKHKHCSKHHYALKIHAQNKKYFTLNSPKKTYVNIKLESQTMIPIDSIFFPDMNTKNYYNATEKKWILDVLQNNVQNATIFLEQQQKIDRHGFKISIQILENAFQFCCSKNYFYMAVIICQTQALYYGFFGNHNDEGDIYLFCTSRMYCIRLYEHEILIATKQIDQLSPTDLNRLFICCCYLGDLKAIKCISKRCLHLNVHTDDDAAFRMSCAQGHLLIAQWLLKKYPKIDTTANNYYAMRQAEMRCRENIIGWLHSLNPILYSIEEPKSGVWKAIHNGRFHFVTMSKKVTYHIEKYRQWIETMFLLWLSSSNSPNKKSFLYQLPLDVIRYIVLFIKK